MECSVAGANTDPIDWTRTSARRVFLLVLSHLRAIRALPPDSPERLIDGPEKGHDLPRVVPAECMLYLTPLRFMSLWTSAMCFDTLAVAVPSGIRQKSAVHFGGVAVSNCAGADDAGEVDDMLVANVENQTTLGRLAVDEGVVSAE